MMRRRLISVDAMLAGGVVPQGSTAAARAAETAAAALDVLRKSISVDVHTHGGKTGVTSKAPPNDNLANAVRAGSLAVACLADVPDGPVLGRNADGVVAAVGRPTGQLCGAIPGAQTAFGTNRLSRHLGPPDALEGVPRFLVRHPRHLS